MTVARIKDTSVDQVKAAADMVAVVSERTQLRKAGARYTGRCPFHEERTPSFSVNAVDKFYYCFGCGAKGDLITFVRETEQLDFVKTIYDKGEQLLSLITGVLDVGKLESGTMRMVMRCPDSSAFPSGTICTSS